MYADENAVAVCRGEHLCASRSLGVNQGDTILTAAQTCNLACTYVLIDYNHKLDRFDPL